MAFNDENFMLNGEAAKELYKYAKDQPIYDFHCHLDPQEIYEDKTYDNIVELWLGGDHYKWRLMRANGVQEKYITGEASNEEKFKAWAETISVAIGSPLYHWSHLEMRDVFGIDKVITKDNWKELYDEMNAFISKNELSPRKLIEQSDVRFIGTTDHPLDDLEWHKKLAEDETIATVVAPTFRPDEAFVDHVNFLDFTVKLSEETAIEITGFESFMAALENRIEFFAEMGTKASDISLAEIVYREATEKELDHILAKVQNGEELSLDEIQKWQTEVLVELSGLYNNYQFVTQIHFGALRNNNSIYAEKLGADAGFDSMGDQASLAANTNALLDRLVRDDKLPKMIWYNLNPAYNTVLANTLANFQANEEGMKAQIQFGAAWWFNDTKLGMIDQLNKYADQGILANFVGMLTDSRSFLSFQRHDYFRRILSSYIGQWVDDEEVPNSEELLRPIIEDISYNNAKEFFNQE